MEDLDSSVDMFEDTQSNQGRDWLGSPLTELIPKHICTYPSVRSTSNHTVLFKLPIPSEGPLEPHPSRPDDKWDADHVRMPHSPESLFPVSQNELKSRWRLIRETYNQPIKTSEELERAILSYNSCGASNKLTFDALHEFFRETLKEKEAEYFFSSLMPNIITLALEIQDKFRGALPILKRGSNRSISMSQVQAGVLLANAFLCTFPRRNSSSHQSALPSINFFRLFQCGSLGSVQQKLMCFTNYFRRILKKRPNGVITYTRRHVRKGELPRWPSSSAKLCCVHITSAGTIEDKGGGMMEIDFANKKVGGGVLGLGSVQEEIRFVICPELVVARLFCETLDDTEAVIVTGCERFNNYEGYAQSFTWSGNYDDSCRPRDYYRRLNTIVVAIDALHVHRPADQFKMEMITRELNKAYTGFSFGQEGAIASGNWGCGAFNGDPLLKFIIQLMAASVCGKPLAYFTFEDTKLRDKLFEMHDFLVKKNTTVGTLWKVIRAYASSDANSKSGETLFDYIYCSLDLDEEDQPMDCEPDETLNAANFKRKFEHEEGETSAAQVENVEPDSLCDGSCTDSCAIHHNSIASSTHVNEDQGFPPVEESTRVGAKSLKTEHQGPSSETRTSPPAVENLSIAPKDIVVTKTKSVNGFVTKKLSLKSDKPTRCSSSFNDSTSDVFSKDTSRRFSSKSEPVDAETCSLLTEEGRRKCLETDQERWDAYQSAMSKFSNDTKIDDTSPNSSQTIKTRTGPVKRKISDYFPKSPR